MARMMTVQFRSVTLRTSGVEQDVQNQTQMEMITMVQQNEALGPADRIISSLLAYTDHMVHNR